MRYYPESFHTSLCELAYRNNPQLCVKYYGEEFGGWNCITESIVYINGGIKFHCFICDQILSTKLILEDEINDHGFQHLKEHNLLSFL